MFDLSNVLILHCNWVEETVGTRRGKTKLKHVWNIPKGHRIVVKCNEFDQPIGEEAGVLGKFLGMVARNGCLCSLSYKDWRLLIGKKERTTNEQKNKEDILNQVKVQKFIGQPIILLPKI